MKIASSQRLLLKAAIKLSVVARPRAQNRLKQEKSQRNRYSDIVSAAGAKPFPITFNKVITYLACAIPAGYKTAGDTVKWALKQRDPTVININDEEYIMIDDIIGSLKSKGVIGNTR